MEIMKPKINITTVKAGLRGLSGRTDLLFALALMTILTVLIFPMPKMLLDIFLAISLTFSVLVLMTVLFIRGPLEFNSFPTVLLIATMLRLSLNVASTRLILSNGHEGPHAAGDVIQAFGNFVMGGNFVIGIIVFIILVLVNFIVITKGSGRIAEVAARFSLDAMPGKQMAIDADLSAGIISDVEAKQRRKALELESNFYGAMDGAAKFVRGDAIAGIIITIINLIAGVIIGMAQGDLDLPTALSTYSILTVGDGLISQIPSLVVSTAAGMLVSKAGIEGSADKALFGQLSAYPSALGMSSLLTMMLALLPGLPFIPFAILSFSSGGMSWYFYQRKELSLLQEQAIEEEEGRLQKEQDSELSIDDMLKIDQIKIEVGYDLLAIVNDNKGHAFIDQIKALRKQLAQEMGVIIPFVRIQDNLAIKSDEYNIKIKEIEVAKAHIDAGRLLCMNPNGEDISLHGKDTIEPVFGLKARWISYPLKDAAQLKGYTIVEPKDVLVTHITEVIKENIADLITMADLDELIGKLSESHKKIIDDMVPANLSKSSLLRIIQNLLTEKVSIRDLGVIIEAINEVCSNTKNIMMITEHVRGRLSRQIGAANIDEDNNLNIVMLDDYWESEFLKSLIDDGNGNKILGMQPILLQNFITQAHQILVKHVQTGRPFVLLTSPSIRPFVRSVVERFRPATVIMSQNEIHPKIRLNTVDYIGMPDESQNQGENSND